MIRKKKEMKDVNEIFKIKNDIISLLNSFL